MDPYAYTTAGGFYYPDLSYPFLYNGYPCQQTETKFIPTSFAPVGSSPNSMAAGETGSVASSPQETKTRLRRACDSCSVRKVKCDEGGPPCQACSSLDIPCTYERPNRRRGPPNRHAEAIKRKKASSPPRDTLAPPSPAVSATTTLVASDTSSLSAESICPWALLTLLVDDYFTYVHPLVPFPHEPSFRAALNNRNDVRDPKLLALLAAMIAALVASFPRKPRQHLKALRSESLFPSSVSLVERCHSVAAEARGPGYLDKELSINDAITSYLLALTGGYIFKAQQAKLYANEAHAMLRSLGVHRPSTISTTTEPADGYPRLVANLIDREIGRRLFWVLFAGVRSLHQIGASAAEFFFAPETTALPYPPFPLEIDDNCIFHDRILPQPPGVVPKIRGFNANVQIYRSYQALDVLEMPYGVSREISFEWQREMIRRALNDCKSIIDELPPELTVTPGPTGMSGAYDLHGEVAGFGQTSTAEGIHHLGIDERETSTQNRRHIGYEIQKANVYVSQLSTKWHIIEKYWTLFGHNKQQAMQMQAAMPSLSSSSYGSQGYNLPSFDEIDKERDNVIRELLMVLSSISQVHIEPNGASILFKVRMIAGSLLDIPQTQKGALALKADQYLAHFLDILAKLERTTPMIKDESSSSLGSETDAAAAAAAEEAELRHWADLREYQVQFMKTGGFFA